MYFSIYKKNHPASAHAAGHNVFMLLALILQPEKPKLTKKKRKADIEDDEEEYEEKKRKDEKKTGSRLAEEEREKILEVMDNEPDVSFNKAY